MKIKLDTVYKSMKKVTPFWVTGISLILALCPLPNEINFTIPINLRILIALIMICVIVVCALLDLVISTYRMLRLDETVCSVKDDDQKDICIFHVFIDYNPLYRSMTMSTIYLITKQQVGKPVALPLCNGRILCRSDNEKIEVICEIPHASAKYDDIRKELMDYDKRLSAPERLVVRPFYEEVKL